jgi:NodT family efflux transporter outer membrane factor (OMF) lipoprotein
MKVISSILVTLLITSCAVGPDYVRPKVATPAKFKEAGKGWKVAKPRDDCPRGEWWKIFHDRKLNRLEQRLNCANQDIATVAAQYRQALAIVDEVAAGFFPVVTASASVTRQQQPTESTAGPTTTHLGSLIGTWEPDLWGSLRRAVEASADTAQASAAQLALTQLSTQATLAQLYFQIRTLDLDQKILNENVSAYKKALKLTENRYVSGVAARSDIIQAQSLVDVSQAQAIDNGVARAKFEHAIAVLIGKPASCFSLAPDPLNIEPPVIPVYVPSVLLERRPDIAQAERLMAAANAQVGVAIAAYFPVLSLTATGITQGPGTGPWFLPSSFGWSLGAQVAETLIDGGLRRATTRAARANYEATVATYRQTVLAAFQDVEDNLSTLRILDAEIIVQRRAVANAKLALKLVMNQYKAGTVGFTDVIVVETLLYNAEKTASDISGHRMTAAVGLIKALGGGWTDSTMQSQVQFRSFAAAQSQNAKLEGNR